MKQRLFDWSLASPDSPYDFLDYIFDGHPFHREKTLWLAFNWVFVGSSIERNGRHFRGSFSSFASFLYFILSHALYWCKMLLAFFWLQSYLISHWKAFMWEPFRRLWNFYSFISFINEIVYLLKENLNQTHGGNYICKTNSMM